MANSRKYLVLENGQYKVRESSTDQIIFDSVMIGGVSGVEITENLGNLDFEGAIIQNIGEPSSGSDATTKSYVDGQIELVSAGFDPKASVDYATTAALPAVTYNNGTGGVGATLTADANGALSVDGASPSVGQRILVKNQVAGLQNGIYDVTAAGDGSNPFVLTRSSDFDNSPAGEVTKGARTLVTTGTANAGYAFFLTTAGTITIGTTALSFSPAGASIVTATAGSGGATQGIVTADTDKGLDIIAGVMEVKVDDNTTQFVSGDVAVKHTLAKTNDNAGSITVRQLVYIKSNGNVDLATAANATSAVELGIVSDASIATTASGQIYLRRGAIVGGYTGLTPGQHVFVHPSTPGSYTQDASTVTTGHLYSVGRALSATQVAYDPRHIAEL
jgi:hypothetical protein